MKKINLDKHKNAYQDMYEHTKDECGKCPAPHSCCDKFYCEVTRNYAKEFHNIELKETGHKTIPFMGEKGCVVQPNLRPLCTVHTCEINSIGVKRNDQKWTKKYFKLRDACEQVECQLFELVKGKKS